MFVYRTWNAEFTHLYVFSMEPGMLLVCKFQYFEFVVILEEVNMNKLPFLNLLSLQMKFSSYEDENIMPFKCHRSRYAFPQQAILLYGPPGTGKSFLAKVSHYPTPAMVSTLFLLMDRSSSGGGVVFREPKWNRTNKNVHLSWAPEWSACLQTNPPFQANSLPAIPW